jgi:hypothetical protein
MKKIHDKPFIIIGRNKNQNLTWYVRSTYVYHYHHGMPCKKKLAGKKHALILCTTATLRKSGNFPGQLIRDSETLFSFALNNIIHIIF